jgi:phosphatidylinositol alpha-1,6-mannosyltransferase
VGERVHLTGALADKTMKEWLRAADVFASPCRSRWAGLEVEGFGIVFAEAALAGLPVIAGRSGGAPEAVIQGETGLVVDGHSVQKVAAALAAILRRTSAERRAMGARGRDLALARHTPAVVGERYRELLRRAAAR